MVDNFSVGDKVIVEETFKNPVRSGVIWDVTLDHGDSSWSGHPNMLVLFFELRLSLLHFFCQISSLLIFLSFSGFLGLISSFLSGSIGCILSNLLSFSSFFSSLLVSFVFSLDSIGFSLGFSGSNGLFF